MALFNFTNTDIINGQATIQPFENGKVQSTDGVRTSGFRPRAQHIPSGTQLTQWTELNGRYIHDPSGWSS